MNLAATALQIAGLLAGKDVLFLADDEQQAEGLAAALRALRPDNSIIFVPSSDALPGDLAGASPANSGRRVAALRKLRDAQQQKSRPRLCVVLSGEAAAWRYPSPEVFGTAPPVLKPGDAIDPAVLAPVLQELGYFSDDRIDEPGEMALRGDVIDLFPADAGMPARIEIHDGHIAAIRSYDPLTQRSVADLDLLEIGRAAEPAIDKPVSILAHMKPATVLFSEKANTRRLRFIELARDAAARSGSVATGDTGGSEGDRGPQVGDEYAGGTRALDAIADDTWLADLAKWRLVRPFAGKEAVPRFAEARSPLAALAKHAAPLTEAGRSLVLAGSERDLRFLRPRLAKRLKMEISAVASFDELEALPSGSVAAIEMPVAAGCLSERYLLVAAADILGSRAVLDLDLARPAISWAEQATAFGVGDVVIHEDHGIALVAGLEAGPDHAGDIGGDVRGDGVNRGASTAEMIVLEYAGGARRLVAVEDATRIWRYGADADAVTLDKLDGSSWQKRRSTIDQAVAASAKGLAALAKERARLRAAVIEPEAAAYERFAGGFAFNETADQARAIGAVRDDLASGRPMDRLVIGDVGYGKTEVALRAAALAALAGYQVIVAAPTTVLVRQHIDTFRKRFAGTDIRVEGLSRLSTAAEKKAVKAGLADGSVQVVVGTAAVMAKGVTYRNLALVVIDEEQRFGAADKARLRGSGEIHLLSLSATPIPRTLQMALVGLQQISIIATPPARRQPIRTSIDQYDDGRIRTALIREKGRGGQSFVVVPQIEDMAEVADKLRRLAPDLSLVEALGKMPATDIDRVMVDFADGRGDILLATNIIEAGLDVPRANTMIIWRADRFGLAQLHQLRGRVGRGNRRGQVILLTRSEEEIAARTLKRLSALATFDRLGAGFDISAQDLDMRGAGDLLGETQAGHMKLIGVDLYQHLLGCALREARGEDVDLWSPELNIGGAGRLPDSWIPEQDVRLSLYARLSRIAEVAELDAFEDELADRFGPLPAETECLIARTRIRLAARAAGIQRIDAGPAAIALTPRRPLAGDPAKLGLEKKDGRYLLRGSLTPADRSERIQALLDELTPP